VLLAVGERESDEYHRQFSGYARALDAHGVAFSGLTLAGHHHFSAVAELANPASEFTKRVIGLARPPAAGADAPI
jgi:arylformamidase